MNINESIQRLKKFFRADKLNKIAKETNFIIRKRKISAPGFVKTMIVGSVKEDHLSLESMVFLLNESGICVKKQSLGSKIKETAVAFLKRVFDELCEEFIGEKFVGKGSKFTDVKVIDSSEIKLNKNLEQFKNKQNGPRCKLQAMYGLLTQTLNCQITKANENDQSYKNYLEHVKANNLILLDLGYFCLESFRQIKHKGGYFLSRLPKNVSVMNLEGTYIDLPTFLKNSSDAIDMQVLVGRQSKLQCRLVAQKLTGEALKKRREKLQRDIRRNGKKSKQDGQIDFWSIYITNLEEVDYPLSEIHHLYALRWQIELFFKLLKSKLSMDHIQDGNPNKAMLMIYSKLITIMIAVILIRAIEAFEISLYKAIDYYKKQIKTIYADILTGRIKKLEKFLLKITNFAQKSKSKNRPSSLEKSQLNNFFSSA